MYCSNCGQKLTGHEDFCPNCGQKIQKENFINPILKKIKSGSLQCFKYVKEHKQTVGISLGCLVIFLVCFILFQTFYDFSKIKWDENAKDYKVEYTEGGVLELAVVAYDKNEVPITDITFEITGGKVEVDGSSVSWTLPDETGEYMITAQTPSGKKITKKVTVLPALESDISDLNGVILDESEETDDQDNDGLTDIEEKELQTNPYRADTDKDGLLDKYELEQSKTDPVNPDSDNDGLNDGDELALGFDPLRADSKEDGRKDGERTITYQIEDEKTKIKMNVQGKGNLPSTTIDVYDNKAFDKIEGLLNTVYNFKTTGILTRATVEIPYSLEKMTAKGLNEDNLTLYYFNEETKALEPVETTVNKINQTLTVTLNHFSKYLIGDANVVLETQETDVLFVIDNSISMYTEEQMIEAGYKYSTGTEGNDAEFKRLTLTNQLIDMFGKGYSFSVAEFSGNYVNLEDFTKDVETAKEKVNSMHGNWKSDGNGTNIVGALEKGLAEFTNNEKNRYLILLTDGKNSKGSLSLNREEIIATAKEKEVSICIIGLGSDIDTEDLTTIASETGCAYYNAKDATALDEIYGVMASKINYNLVDVDNDGTVDGTVIADSGFLANRDGFSFANFKSNKSFNGHCYGMAVFAELYYTKHLPMTLDEIHKHTIFKRFEPANGYNLNNTYFENYQNLYEYEMTSPIMQTLFYKLPSDYWGGVTENTMRISQKYVDELNEIGAMIEEIEYNHEDFSKFQLAIVNLDSANFYKNTTKEENQILNAIYRLFVLQIDDDRTSFSVDPDEAFDLLIEKLNQNIPVVTIIYGNGNHAINATRLIQDNDDANLFYLEVYDNNFPGEKRYIEIHRSKMNKIQLSYTAWTNDYDFSFKYDQNNDGTLDDITVSLAEYQLE